jgi:hypothetical protein
VFEAEAIHRLRGDARIQTHRIVKIAGRPLQKRKRKNRNGDEEQHRMQ